MRISEVMSNFRGSGRQALVDFLESRGYRFVGEGAYSTVFRAKNGGILKVYGQGRWDGDDDLSYEYDPMEFYQFAKSSNSQFLPKFGNAKTITVSGKQYVAIPTEELSETPLDKNLEGIYWAIGDEPLETVISKNPEIAALVKKHGVETFKGFNEIVDLICRKFPCDDIFEDGNILWRGNVPVINDPWVSTLKAGRYH